jgi:hypothetical protein
MRALMTDDAAEPCSVGLGVVLGFARLAPPSATGAKMTAGLTVQPGAAPASADDLAGYWLAQGGRHLLLVGRGGHYVLDHDGDHPRDSGKVRVDKRGTVTLVSDARSRTCEPGARTTMHGVDLGRVRFPSGHPLGGPRLTSALRGVVGRSRCDAEAVSGQTWFRVLP